jgi:hypothetical protein
VRAWLLAVGLFLSCGGDPPAPEPITFSGEPAAIVTSTSGATRVGVRWSPAPPAVGVAAAELTLTDAAGAAVEGVTLSGLLWMPAHGHAASVQPEMTETAAGVFLATPLSFFMPGAWELRLTLAGSVDDTAAVSIELP